MDRLLTFEFVWPFISVEGRSFAAAAEADAPPFPAAAPPDAAAAAPDPAAPLPPLRCSEVEIEASTMTSPEPFSSTPGGPTGLSTEGRRKDSSPSSSSG